MECLCRYKACLRGNKSWNDPYKERYRNLVEADTQEQAPYCSLECAVLDGYMDLRYHCEECPNKTKDCNCDCHTEEGRNKLQAFYSEKVEIILERIRLERENK